MVEIAPLQVPLKRRRQTFSVFLWASFLPICLSLLSICVIVPLFWPLLIFYLIWAYFDTAPRTGARRSDWIRNLRCWRWFVNFFPIRVVKEADLDPKHNYLFGYHPHGIIAVGAWGAFGTEGAQISKIFPGLNIRLLTLDTNFNVPFYRDLLMAFGLASVAKESCNNILQKGPGNSCMIVVGGASESLTSFPGTYDLILKKRYGFVKVAMRNGARLVPVLSFGETDVYDQVEAKTGTWLKKIQRKIQEIFGFTTPIAIGRGIFVYDFGILPRRRPIHVVVGKPIEVKRIDNPTNEEAEVYHQQYMNSLKEIFEKYKDQYASDRKSELRFVE
ncbi:diacylglycerol acyltransferase [Basidiobolus meristosporus CBS 931.73]|uniref:Diacylglycerol O-acyltransferase n=1 Tax=Basidiobolus meristosporus CBS 931.73 TaxID=1314790 RepID=A0A1Y1XRQ1_9FUNG|nr:diacylglycerol acyltransferase [Basidiobolus meristosporus CBS 931.73]|eukprot:ORX88345.1 diacylglycerol acyltransferase [Basidiobolus meristosporus CBS 931.73]